MSTVLANIPKELKALEQWVCANSDSKMPMVCTEPFGASVSDPFTWSEFDLCAYAVENGLYEWAGFVFADNGYVGIDIDHGFDEDGLPTDEAMEVIEACKSYTEISKSGKGFHIICRGDLPFDGNNNRKGWEIYKTKRYFLLTGNTVLYDEIREAQEGIDYARELHFSNGIQNRNSGREGVRGRRIWNPDLRCQNGIITEEAECVASGSRHLSLVSYCGLLHTLDNHKDTIKRMMAAANEQYMKPPLPENEVDAIIKSVTRYRR